MAGRPNTYIGTGSIGDIDWIDLENNWRQADAEWLQERGVTRVSTTPAAETNLNGMSTGRVFFSVSEDRLYLKTSSGYTNPLQSEFLVATDTSTTVTLGISSKTPNITFNKDTGAVSTSSLTATSLSSSAATITAITSTAGSNANGFRTTASGVEINTTGSNLITLTTGAAGLIVSGGISVGASAAVSSNLTVGGTITVTGLSTLNGGLTVSGSTSLAATTVSTTLSVTGATTVSTIAASTSVQTPLITSATGADITLTPATGRAIRTSADFYYGAGTTVRNAWVVYGADPGVGNVPEGTIWIS